MLILIRECLAYLQPWALLEIAQARKDRDWIHAWSILDLDNPKQARPNLGPGPSH